MPNRPAPKNPANSPPRNPGRLKKPPAGEGRPIDPGWPGCVMLRSIGRALGEVAVEGGAENVCPPRLPKLPPRPARASASLAMSAIVAAMAHAASKGRKRKLPIGFLRTGFPIFQATILGCRGLIVRGAAVSRSNLLSKQDDLASPLVSRSFS